MGFSHRARSARFAPVPADVDPNAYQRAGYVAALDAARRTYGELNDTQTLAHRRCWHGIRLSVISATNPTPGQATQRRAKDRLAGRSATNTYPIPTLMRARPNESKHGWLP